MSRGVAFGGLDTQMPCWLRLWWCLTGSSVPYLFLQADIVSFLFLPRDKLLYDLEELRRDRLEVLVEIPLDRQPREDVVIDEGRAQVCQHTW